MTARPTKTLDRTEPTSPPDDLLAQAVVASDPPSLYEAVHASPSLSADA